MTEQLEEAEMLAWEFDQCSQVQILVSSSVFFLDSIWQCLKNYPEFLKSGKDLCKLVLRKMLVTYLTNFIISNFSFKVITDKM